jgi:hypothetical protein
MVTNPGALRRGVGALALVMALGMLIGGETVFKGKLHNLAFILYWLGCLGFTVLAIIIALVDARALQTRSRREQRELLESTLKELEGKAKKAGPRPQGRKRR